MLTCVVEKAGPIFTFGGDSKGFTTRYGYNVDFRPERCLITYRKNEKLALQGVRKATQQTISGLTQLPQRSPTRKELELCPTTMGKSPRKKKKKQGGDSTGTRSRAAAAYRSQRKTGAEGKEIKEN
ncbi:hypothetical protein AgCh_022500 [Apium graveolens]